MNKTKTVIGSPFFTSSLTLLKEIDEVRELKMLQVAVRQKIVEAGGNPDAPLAPSKDQFVADKPKRKLKKGDKRNTPKFRAHLRRIARARSVAAFDKKVKKVLKKSKAKGK